MAHHNSAIKRARQNEKRRMRNRHHRSTLRTALKDYRALLTSKKADEAAQAYTGVQQAIDKAVSKGIIHRNAAARYKSRLATALKKMQAA
ncbi:MAG TPA: 30S ribosomal protein S20 [bacterium]|nr:30S ribosomal protein S20 [bacterium]